MVKQNRSSIDLNRFEGALRLLRQAHAYQCDTGRTAWDFAVEISALKSKSLTRNDLRWLVCKGLVEHQREITPRGDNTRIFRTTGALTFAKRSCFILTEAGVRTAVELLDEELHDEKLHDEKLHDEESGRDLSTIHAKPPNGSTTTINPAWDCDRHELWVGNRVVKRFKRPAVNQETVLATFQEDGWPSRIDDPLPMLAEQDPRRRLHDTIKCLNRNQKPHLIHFQGDGTGEGVLWEFTAEVHSGHR